MVLIGEYKNEKNNNLFDKKHLLFQFSFELEIPNQHL
ncbi:hypothetical protein CbuK_1446 [Coxiella burnetii CbuK_Q154]|nr:hypothetical protein CbuK_1446 [Coxiella burnetii CbuK_Q154]AIT63683.1 hypothetical protein CBNA_1440 [Coxiella burnetii str. Namibia]